ncbi:unnamed protein product [Penicillium roqueforti FM164]|uniref:Genomic scaffold, ProqFM164S02 n=1 Tax=Penicillium roqueforti (strain FM164) TaxID=1365484 RepID=W6QQH0_PENRF|nr:unnamed protein product [Penicillium roqueforti FM164]
MITDVISMVDLAALSTHCKTVRSLARSSTDLVAGLPWDRFYGVIYDEQMRQDQDVSYRDLLRRSGTLTCDDLATPNSKAISSLSDPQFQTSPAIVKLNSLRHVI